MGQIIAHQLAGTSTPGGGTPAEDFTFTATGDDDFSFTATPA